MIMRRLRTSALQMLGPVALAVLAGLSTPAYPAASTKAFESSEYRYVASFPSACRSEEGPGTLDAICSPDLDPDKSAEASADASLVFEVVAEPVPGDVGKASTVLAQSFGEGDFKQELPEMVCGGGSDRVRIDNLAKVVEDTRVVYTADVICPEVKFLGIGERRASARYLITPGLRYRLVARALSDDYTQRKDTIDAFFSSFKVLAQEKRSQ
jgi:hypothetical protein